MTLNLIKEQTTWVDQWTLGLIEGLKTRDLEYCDSVGTSIEWQIGHILISKYYHGLQSTISKGSNLITTLNRTMPIAELFQYYFAGSDPKAVWPNRHSKEELLDYYKKVGACAQHALDELTEKELTKVTEVNNPVAQSKYDALTFVFKHQMWHNGQIALIKRVLHDDARSKN